MAIRLPPSRRFSLAGHVASHGSTPLREPELDEVVNAAICLAEREEHPDRVVINLAELPTVLQVLTRAQIIERAKKAGWDHRRTASGVILADPAPWDASREGMPRRRARRLEEIRVSSRGRRAETMPAKFQELPIVAVVVPVGDSEYVSGSYSSQSAREALYFLDPQHGHLVEGYGARLLADGVVELFERKPNDTYHKVGTGMWRGGRFLGANVVWPRSILPLLEVVVGKLERRAYSDHEGNEAAAQNLRRLWTQQEERRQEHEWAERRRKKERGLGERLVEKANEAASELFRRVGRRPHGRVLK